MPRSLRENARGFFIWQFQADLFSLLLFQSVYSRKRLFRCGIFPEPFVGFSDKFEVDISNFVQMLGPFVCFRSTCWRLSVFSVVFRLRDH